MTDEAPAAEQKKSTYLRAMAWHLRPLGPVILVILAIGYSYRADWPAKPDRLPDELTRVAGPAVPGMGDCLVYDLGGFIDHEYLYCVDAPDELGDRLVAGWKLQLVQEVPSEFWNLPPHYWPRRMPVEGEGYRSPEFSAKERGPDGEHFLVVHDRKAQKYFIWHKSNF